MLRGSIPMTTYARCSMPSLRAKRSNPTWLLGVCFVVVLLAMKSIAEAKAPSPAAVEAFNQGVGQFNAGQFNQAVPYFDKAIANDPSFAEAYYARAACKHSGKDAQGALSDLNGAIQLKPDYWSAYGLRGAVWYEQEQWDPALQDFDMVLKHKPRDAQALLGRGIIALRQEHYETAQHDLGLFLKVRPDDPMASRLRKLLRSLAQDFQENAAESTEPSAEPPPSGSPVRRVSSTSQRLTEELLMNSHQLSEAYGRKVMRGERAEAVGNTPFGEAPRPQQGGVEIVDPGH